MDGAFQDIQDKTTWVVITIFQVDHSHSIPLSSMWVFSKAVANAICIAWYRYDVHYNRDTKLAQILTISTLVRSHSLCATANPFSRSVSVTVAGCTIMRAKVPAALRLANVPGLMTSTDSTTYCSLEHRAFKLQNPSSGANLP